MHSVFASTPKTHLLSAAVTAALALAACGSGSSSSDDSSPASTSPATGGSAAAFGTPHKATGKPLVLGLLNLETGPVTFPEYRQAAEAAVKYVNAYKGGIGGRPIEIASCATDGQPSTSARCAGQILDKRPVAVLGGADTGAPGAIGVYGRAKLPYLGGVPFTPVETNAPNAAIFVSVAGADLAATVQYAHKQGAKKLAVIYTDDTQGKAGGLGIIAPVAKQLGMEVKTIPVAPSAADLASTAAAAMASQPDAIFLDSPNACPGLAKALKAVGNTAQLLGIDVCVSPPALKAAGAAADGLIFAQPFPTLSGGDKDTKLFLAAIGRYAPKHIAVDSISQIAFASVMNIQSKLSALKPGDMTLSGIMKAFKSGSDQPNFMSHPYTCNGSAIPSQKSVCNAYQIIKQYKNGKIVAPDGDSYVSAGQYLK